VFSATYTLSGIFQAWKSQYFNFKTSRTFSGLYEPCDAVDRYSHAFPRHQPELDTLYMKAKCNSWETTNEAAYMDPKLQRNPALMANVDTELDEFEARPELPLADCYNCNVRPRDRVHPSIVEEQYQSAQRAESQPSWTTMCSSDVAEISRGAITSKIKHAIKLKTNPARLAQLLQPSLAFCFSLQPISKWPRTGRCAVIGCKLKQDANEGCNSCAS